MTTTAAFTAAIMEAHWAHFDDPAQPNGDAVRLVFADALEERGECGRAEFIRVQIELAGLEQEKLDRFNDDTDWRECTGVSAGWCPNCGDCCCPHDGEGNYDSKDDPACPLHSADSLHDCLRDIAHREESLRRRERELLAAHGHEWFPPPVGRDGSGFVVAADGSSCAWHVESGSSVTRIELAVTRGFISGLTLPTLASWLACQACNGRGRLPYVGGDDDDDPCPDCGGTGDGLGPRLCRVAPLEQVRFADKQPVQGAAGGNAGSYYWHNIARGAMPAGFVPEPLYLELGGELNSNGFRYYPSIDAAYLALSRAAILHARGVRGPVESLP